MPHLFQPLDRSHDRDAFDCGVKELNDYLKKYARQNDEKGLGKTFVIIAADNPKKILGFYTISTGQIEIDSLPKERRKKLPRYPIPVLRLGKFAVDIKNQRKGLGTSLLMHALQSAKTISKSVGVFAVVLDAKNEKLKAFYEKSGFVSLVSDPLTMVLPMESIA